jgi:inorganic pyrophosphatase
MEDEAGLDDKVSAVPVGDLHPFFFGIRNLQGSSASDDRADQAFLRTLRGSGEVQMGKGTRWVDAPETDAIVRDAMERANRKESIRWQVINP